MQLVSSFSTNPPVYIDTDTSEASSDQPIISVRQLNHYFGDGALRKQVLRQINLDIRSGEIVIMTGPSGSGKTTLLTLMGCLRAAQAGSLKVFGEEIIGASKQQLTRFRQNIGYIFQAHNLMSFLTAKQNVRMALELHEDLPLTALDVKAISMLEAVGLGSRVEYFPENLSGGQKQRVAIARALVNQPRLLLADEPTASLDKQSGREVVTLMQRLSKEQGCTILLVTHDNRILDVADRIIYMEDGQLTDASQDND